MRRFIVRVDAGGSVGFGHAVRSLALARFLRAHHGIETIFYANPCEALEAMYWRDFFGYVLNNGLPEEKFLRRTPAGSVVFIDKQFPYDGNIIQELSTERTIIMFHNECEGMFECDQAIFPSAHLSDEVASGPRWKGKRLKHGPEYVIINESVLDWQGETSPHIAVTTGASDPGGMMIRILEWLNESDLEMPVKALLGFDFQHWPELENLLPKLKPSIAVKEFNYDDLLSARLALSTFGVTAYELIYANVPLITTGLGRKGNVGSETLQGRYGCNYHLPDFTGEQLVSSVRTLWEDEGRLARMRGCQYNLIDGKGLERLGQIVAETVGE